MTPPHTHHVPSAQRDSHKMVIQLISPDSCILLLHMDYAENYSHIQQIMSQQKWFKRLGLYSLPSPITPPFIRTSYCISSNILRFALFSRNSSSRCYRSLLGF